MEQNQLKIIVLAAGESKRFKDKGYIVSKPFLPIDGMTMLDRVISNIGDIECKVYPVFLNSDLKNGLVVSKYFPLDAGDSTFEGIKGSGSAIWAFEEYVFPWFWDGEFVIINCDQLVEDGAIERGVEFFRKKETDAGVFCTYNHEKNPNYSSVEIGKDGTILGFIEKGLNGGPPIADIGCLYFKNGHEFIEALSRSFANKDLKNGEFCHAPAINYLIHDGKKVLPYFVNGFVNIGIPEVYENYISK